MTLFQEGSTVSNNKLIFPVSLETIIIKYNKYNFKQYLNTYPTVTSARSCNNVGHLFWFTILAQHKTNDVILYIHSVHKHWGNTFQRQNYKMRLKQRSLNWINWYRVVSPRILFAPWVVSPLFPFAPGRFAPIY
jgi:hypothetical protein